MKLMWKYPLLHESYFVFTSVFWWHYHPTPHPIHPHHTRLPNPFQGTTNVYGQHKDSPIVVDNLKSGYHYTVMVCRVSGNAQSPDWWVKDVCAIQYCKIGSGATVMRPSSHCGDHSVNRFSQWEVTFHSSVVSRCSNPFAWLSLHCGLNEIYRCPDNKYNWTEVE